MAWLGRKAAAVVLIALMAFAAMMLWVGIPLAWLWIGSMVVDSSQPSMGPYMLVVVGIIASVIVDALLISRLNRQYERVTGSKGHVRVQLPWMKSMRGERDLHPREYTVLDTIMVATVALAALAMGVWFFFFAGSPLPGA